VWGVFPMPARTVPSCLLLAYRSLPLGLGPFGLGWSLSLPGVTRQTSKGVPRTEAEDGVTLAELQQDLCWW